MKLLKLLQTVLRTKGNKKNFYVLFFFAVFFLPNNSYAYSPGFDYPVGIPGGIGYYDAQDFGLKNNEMGGYHLGEDWNGVGRGDSDLGDPLYSISDGKVASIGNRRGWGNVMLIQYRINESTIVNALYGHLKDVLVVEGQEVKKSEKVGTIGKGDRNRFSAHLHFELRNDLSIGFGTGYGEYKQNGYLDPSEFIDAHRPVSGQVLTAKQDGANKIVLTWNKSESDKFDKYELYRSEVVGGTEEETKRTLIFSGKEVITATDEGVVTGKTYYYRLYTLYKNGLVGKSEEVAIEQKREVTKITTNTYSQSRPVIDGDIIYWTDNRPGENGGSSYKIFYYNIKTKEEGFIDVLSTGVKNPEQITAAGGRVVFVGADALNFLTGKNIYHYNTQDLSESPVTMAVKDQLSPDISEEGIVVWSDLRNGRDLDIYYLNTTKSDGEVLLAGGIGNQRNPKIWGNKVIWQDSRVSNRHDLYLKEIGKEEVLLATNVKDSSPDFWENWVVWAKDGKVSLINTENKEIIMVTETSGFNPKVRDGRVVYVGQEGLISYIHVYDIATGTDLKIDFPLNYQSFPDISDNIVVFDHSEKQTVPDMNIYMVYI